MSQDLRARLLAVWNANDGWMSASDHALVLALIDDVCELRCALVGIEGQAKLGDGTTTESSMAYQANDALAASDERLGKFVKGGEK